MVTVVERPDRGLRLLLAVPASFACWWLAWVVAELLIEHPSSRYFDADDPAIVALVSLVLCIPFGIVSIPITCFWMRRWGWWPRFLQPVLNLAVGVLTGLALYGVHHGLSTGSMGWYGNPATDIALWVGSGLGVYHVACLTLAMLADFGRR